MNTKVSKGSPVNFASDNFNATVTSSNTSGVTLERKNISVVIVTKVSTVNSLSLLFSIYLLTDSNKSILNFSLQHLSRSKSSRTISKYTKETKHKRKHRPNHNHSRNHSRNHKPNHSPSRNHNRNHRHKHSIRISTRVQILTLLQRTNKTNSGTKMMFILLWWQTRWISGLP